MKVNLLGLSMSSVYLLVRSSASLCCLVVSGIVRAASRKSNMLGSSKTAIISSHSSLCFLSISFRKASSQPSMSPSRSKITGWVPIATHLTYPKRVFDLIWFDLRRGHSSVGRALAQGCEGSPVKIPVDPTREIYLFLLPRVARLQYKCGVLGQVRNKSRT